MDRPSILIIEDGKAVKNLIAATLEIHDYHYTWANKGGQGILSTASQRPNIILLDLGLLDMDGVDVILRVCSRTNTPIITISARSEDSDRIAALDARADDYLTRPFSMDELLVRLRSTQRRLRYMQPLGGIQSFLFASDGFTIDYAVGCVYLDGEELHLTPYEYKLLCPLTHNVGKALTHSYITREIWGVAWEGDVTSLRVLMTPLCKKIEKDPSQPQYIQTRTGVGYRIAKR